ncbi:hypothetical protein I3842_08G046900 [Carya illinoinensis]|uniref:MBD domain-containing protein n=1 Tax=Carya illinoinensis TaxID=32201 RepID=A0A922E8S0_CARIL|nr:hypothetical protein I3842_08G046900 [Carya illinoinensis]
MASASVIRLEALSLVDLRLLSQPELYSLVLCSSSSDPSFSSTYGNDDFLIPKIDRSVFNESAGSRKQTYSRLRLAPRKPQSPTRSSFSSTARQIPEPLDEENSQIISLLKQLFAAETSPTQTTMAYAGLQIIPVAVASSGREEETRKRGRPPKNENRMIERNCGKEAKGDGGGGGGEQERGCDGFGCVGECGLVEDPYGEELKRRTEVLQTEADFLGFLSGLRGEWWRKSRKKRIVTASDFGHALPNGWKLMLSIKKRAGRVRLHCRRYISPNGWQFVSCKDVASYFFSSFGLQHGSQLRSGHPDANYLLGRKMDFGDDSETQWPAPPGNERTFIVENNVIKVSFPSVEEQKLEIGSESGLNGKDKTSSGEDIEVKCFTSAVGDMKVDGGYTCENSESASGFGNHVCTEVNTSGNHVITVGFGNNHASQNDKAVIGSKQEGSSEICLVISSWNEQYIVENDANNSSNCTGEGLFQ